jgi:RNA polymerase sigma-70 factor (ECF subfamily)
MSFDSRPFQVAGRRFSVREWNVSREPALRRAQGALVALDQRDLAPVDDAEALPLRFDQVFRRYAPYVGVLVLKLIGRPGDVDDVVQDVFLQAHRGLSKLRDPAAVRPWLRRITVRRAQRYLRKRWVLRFFAESDVDVATDLVDPAASPEERAQIAHIYRTLERMPRDERLAWVLRFVEGETLESVAELLGSSVSTVQRRLRAASAKMGEIR